MSTGKDRFRRKRALVTGAASGIGRSIALRLAEEGARVAVCDVNDEGSKETVRAITEKEGEAFAVHCDVAKVDEISSMVDIVHERFEVVDILVNAAGIGETNTAYDEIDEALWDSIYAVNVRGPFFLAQQIAGKMIEKEIKGSVISISSTEGKTNIAGSIVYASSKRALIGLTQALAIAFAPYDINVNAVCPGLVDTPIWHGADRKMELEEGSLVNMVAETAMERGQLKLMRVGQPEDIAAMVAFLASGEASYITGQAMNVCGGLDFS